MTNDELREQADRTFNTALEYLVKEGWPTREFDEQAADRMYATWLTDTQSMWKTDAQAAAQRRTTGLKYAQETRVNFGHGDCETNARDSTIYLAHYAGPTTEMGVTHG